jgi:inner membrane protein
MPTIIGHAVSGLALSAFPPVRLFSPRDLLLGLTCAVLPDIDSLGFRLGIPYAHPLGHRGLSHSFFFAALAALLALRLSRPGLEESGKRLALFLFFFACGTVHILLDAMTDGGLGVALWAPFSNHRYFLPWRPIRVAPIGVEHMFGGWGARVLASEFWFVYLPGAALFLLATAVRRLRSK